MQSALFLQPFCAAARCVVVVVVLCVGVVCYLPCVTCRVLDTFTTCNALAPFDMFRMVCLCVGSVVCFACVLVSCVVSMCWFSTIGAVC